MGIVVFLIMFYFIGILLAILGAKTILHAIKIKNWPTYSAIIESAKIIKRVAPIGPVRNIGRYSYGIEVRFIYEIDGAIHEGRQYQYSENYSSELESVKRIVDTLNSGEPIAAHINPKNPAEAYLQGGVSLGDCTALIAGGVFLGFSVLASVAAILWY